ncbi:MAG: NTP transferase domain-containing protein, partial [Solirubrobacterales bacterium]
MGRVVVVQARMTSTRLPGKVLMDLDGQPLLERQLARLARCERVDEIVLATTVNDTDDPLVALADRLGLRWHRGSEDDVLGRYVGAAREADADMVVRVTSDCPLIDAGETDAVIGALGERRHSCDYANNFAEPVLPLGLATEAFWRDVLERADRMATSVSAREHVTPFIHSERRELFVLHGVRGSVEAPDLR